MKKIRSVCSVLMSLSLALCIGTEAMAAKSISELQQGMKERSKVIEEKKSQIQDKQDEKEQHVAKRMELDLQISGLEEDIDDVEDVIKQKDAEINEKNKRIDELEQSINDSEDTLKDRVRVMYEYGSTSYLEILLEADGFGDLLTRISVLKDIVSHDKEIINQYIAAQKEIEDAKAVVENEKAEQVSAKDILESKKSELKKLSNEKKAIIDSINSDIKTLEAEEKAAEDDYNSMMAAVKKAQKELEEKQKAEAAAAAQKSSGGSKSTSQSVTVTKGTGQFTWPAAASTRVTSGFGSRAKPNAAATSNHRGIDIGAASGTDVVAADAGTVIVAGSNRSYGNYVVIDHGNGYTTLYAHNSRLCVSVNQSVSRGQVIAKVGSTGNSTGPHVHFEVSKNGSVVNPMNFF